MKHALAIAIQEGFTASLAAEIDNGVLTQAQAGQIVRFALALVREYLKGGIVMGKPLTFFTQDGQKWEEFLIAHKINMQQFGD